MRRLLHFLHFGCRHTNCLARASPKRALGWAEGKKTGPNGSGGRYYRGEPPIYPPRCRRSSWKCRRACGGLSLRHRLMTFTQVPTPIAGRSMIGLSTNDANHLHLRFGIEVGDLIELRLVLGVIVVAIRQLPSSINRARQSALSGLMYLRGQAGGTVARPARVHQMNRHAC